MPTLNGTAGGDNLVGTNGPDTLNGFEGDDALDGNGGVDQLFGGPGDDFLSIRSSPIAGGVFDGGEGTDTLYVSLLANASGVPGASLTGVSLVSLERLLFGETLGFLAVADQKIQVNWSQLASFSPELVERPLGRDTFDILVPNAGTYSIPNFLKSWGSTDTISLTAAGTGDYTLSASGSFVGIEALNGAGGNDRLTGNSLINLLSGGSGDDTLIGGAGADRLTGGLGNDTFIDTRAGLDGDAITDFTVADRIVLTDANLATFTFSLNGNSLTYSGGALTFGSALNGSLMATSAVGGGVQLGIDASTINEARSDFNGDGRSDVLWENANNLLYSNWLGTANGAFLIHDAQALDNWAIGNIVAVGDFNSDGRDDTLWRDSSGAIYLSPTGVGGSFIFSDSAGSVANVPNDWHILGAGDFDGDGKDDILWRNDDGRISNWLSNGDYTFDINDTNAMTGIFANSTVRGVGDFNGDGRDDIVTSFTIGGVNSYELSFGLQSGAFGTEDPFTGFGVPTEWQIAGIGDFNGDGRDDLLWRHENGTISNWLYAGGLGLGTFNINDAVAMTNVSIDWQVVAVGDYNGDGWDDILWRNSTTGHLSDWLGQQNGGWLINDIHALVAVPLDWVVGPHEFLSGAGLWDY